MEKISMKRLDNAAVVASFMDRRAADSHTGNLWTDGNRLMSYLTCIAEFTVIQGAGLVLLVNDTRYSMTTSAKHQAPLRHALRRMAGNYSADRVILNLQDGHSMAAVHHVAGIPIRCHSLANMLKHGDGTYWQ